VCWLCGYDIDLTLDARDRMSATVDHVIPLDRGGSECDPANLRPAHRACNSSKGNRTSKRQPGTSRRW
jgi:5-methylcytosine-specific restriction endonuclease McrA